MPRRLRGELDLSTPLRHALRTGFGVVTCLEGRASARPWSAATGRNALRRRAPPGRRRWRVAARPQVPRLHLTVRQTFQGAPPDATPCGRW